MTRPLVIANARIVDPPSGLDAPGAPGPMAYAGPGTGAAGAPVEAAGGGMTIMLGALTELLAGSAFFLLVVAGIAASNARALRRLSSYTPAPNAPTPLAAVGTSIRWKRPSAPRTAS